MEELVSLPDYLLQVLNENILKFIKKLLFTAHISMLFYAYDMYAAVCYYFDLRTLGDDDDKLEEFVP